MLRFCYLCLSVAALPIITTHPMIQTPATQPSARPRLLLRDMISPLDAYSDETDSLRPCASGGLLNVNVNVYRSPPIANESPWPETRSPLRLGCRNWSISQVFADQSSQEYEHAEKPKDFPHARLLLGKLLQARVHDTLRRHDEGGACARSNHLPRSKGRPSSCKDDVGSLRGVLATSSRPCRTQAAEEEVSSVL